MDRTEILHALTTEIARLTAARDLLSDEPEKTKRGPGRPKGSSGKATSFNPEEFAPRRRTMSAEGKARIAAAQRKRWAVQKGSAVKRFIRTNSRQEKAIPAGSKKVASKKPAEVAARKAPAKKRSARRAPTKTPASATVTE